MPAFDVSLQFVPGLQPATVAGMAAVAVNCCWPLLHRRKTLLGLQVCASLLFGLHYLLLGAPTAAAMCGASAAQGLAAALVARRSLRDGIIGATAAASLAITVATWTGLPSLLAQTGQLLSLAGRLQRDTQRLRWLFLASEAFWVSHNLLVGSRWGLASDSLAVTMLLIGLWRGRERKPAGVAAAA